MDTRKHIEFQQLLVDLKEYPKVKQSDPQAQYTLGDAHANTIKLIHFFISIEVFEFEPKKYQKMLTQYHERGDVQQLKKWIKEITINKAVFIRLIGDLMADRALLPDGLNLLVLDQLREGEVSYEIPISNHDIEFIEAYEVQDKFLPPRLVPSHAASLIALNAAIEKQIFTRDEIYLLIERAYKPALRVLCYTLNEDGTEITYFTHGVGDLDCLPPLIQKFNLAPYRDESAEVLALTIDSINDAFQEYVRRNEVHTLYNPDILRRAYEGERIDKFTYPLEFLMWNRQCKNLKRPSEQHGYKINFVHGHDLQEKSANNIYNLDNICGKGYDWNLNKSPQLVTRGISRLKPPMLPLRTNPEDRAKIFQALATARSWYNKAMQLNTALAQDLAYAEHQVTLERQALQEELEISQENGQAVGLPPGEIQRVWNQLSYEPIMEDDNGEQTSESACYQISENARRVLFHEAIPNLSQAAARCAKAEDKAQETRIKAGEAALDLVAARIERERLNQALNDLPPSPRPRSYFFKSAAAPTLDLTELEGLIESQNRL